MAAGEADEHESEEIAIEQLRFYVSKTDENSYRALEERLRLTKAFYASVMGLGALAIGINTLTHEMAGGSLVMSASFSASMVLICAVATGALLDEKHQVRDELGRLSEVRD